jgi:hypothetical protein
MTKQPLDIEALGDHDYLAYVGLDDDSVTLRVRADPAVVSRIAGVDADETRVIAAAIAYLTERQRADDLPADIDLQDVATFYGDFIERLQKQLQR